MGVGRCAFRIGRGGGGCVVPGFFSYPKNPPPYHPCHVRIYGWHGLLVCERCNGAGGIRSDSRELDELIRLTWQRGVVASCNGLRQRMEIRSAGVVSQPIPGFPYGSRARAGQRTEIRKLLDEPRIVLRHATHLRLLQHELGHEHAIGIARAAPGQVARGAGPPRKQLAAEPHPLFPGSSLAFTPHRSPRYCTWQTGRSSRLTRYDWSRARASARSTTWGASASSWSTCSAASPSGVSGSPARSSRPSRWATAPSSSCCLSRGSRGPSRASRPATSSPARCRCTTPAPSSPNR